MKKIFTLGLLGLVLVGCSSPTSAPTPILSDTATSVAVSLNTLVHWDTAPEALLLRYWPAARNTPPYAVTALIPPLQVWGDGRIIWRIEDTTDVRQMMVGQLSEAQMQELFERIVTAGFFDWEANYTEAAPLPGDYLTVNLASHSAAPKQVYAVSSQAPPGFVDLLAYLKQMPALVTDTQPYVPEQAYLSVLPTDPAAVSAISLEWPAAAPPLAAVSDGLYIEGEPLMFVWNELNQHEAAPVVVVDDGKPYWLSLAIPGVSLCTGPEAFEVGWECP